MVNPGLCPVKSVL